MKKFLFLFILCVCGCVMSNAQTTKNSISVGYANMGIFDSGGSMDGISVDYLRNVSTSDLGFKVNCGGGFKYMGDTENGVKERFSAISLVPVNLSYPITINENLSLEPFAALRLNYNFYWNLEKSGVSLDVFKYSDTNHFQIGGDLGVAVNIDNFIISYAFRPDFSDLVDGAKSTYTNTFSLGLRF